MNFKRAAASVLAAATVISVPSNSIPAFIPSAVFAEAHATGAALPEWIPCDLESAIEFRNTYGATHIQDGLVCIVFREHYEKAADDGPRYDIRTTKDMMSELTHKLYSSDECESCYEVVVYYAPEEKGEFEVALVDTWLKSSQLDLGYDHAVAYYSFNIDENKDITESDIFSWLPDCYTEYNDFVSKKGRVSAKDDLVVFCLDHNAGTPYKWDEAPRVSSKIMPYHSVDCSMETAIPLDGGEVKTLKIYKAAEDGNAIIRWDYFQDHPYSSNKIERTLIADCTISDNAQKVTLDDSYIQDAEFSYAHYSIYSNDLNFSSYNIYNSPLAVSKSAVISSEDELVNFLSDYLQEGPLKAFVSQYSDSFFEDNVLLLSTYLDPYKGRVLAHGLDSVQSRDGRLTINCNDIIYSHLMRTSYFDILKVVIPKDELQEEIVWQNNDTLNFDLKRISIIDEDTGITITIPKNNRQHLFGDIMNYFEGNNPYYLDTEFIDFDWRTLSVDEKYLPDDYVLSDTEPVTIKEYAYNSADIIFRVKYTEAGVKYASDSYSALSQGMFAENIFPDCKPAVAASVEELSETLSHYFSETYHQKYLSTYDEAFFADNVLLLDFMVDSTGGQHTIIDSAEISGEKINVYYTKPSTDFGVCNTDYFFVLQVKVPRSEYSGQKIEWKCVGDVNGDSAFGVADLVALQKWLIASPDIELSDPAAADMCKDNVLDVFDLCSMRKKLIEISMI